jgi:hypothetical protein
MLANFSSKTAQSGSFNREVHLPATSQHELINFIAKELPRWRDRDERNTRTSEHSLTSQLCNHLNSVSRHSIGWDYFQFRTEVPDEMYEIRKIDLAPSPCGATVWIEGRRVTDFEILFPIECKRLPTPKGTNRDEREYVVSGYSSGGGIQRFKAGHHGAAHEFAAMIAYVEKETMVFWDKRVRGWIKELAKSGEPGWTTKDFLRLEHNDMIQRIALLRSVHVRDGGLRNIEIHHLWVNMN